MDEKDERSKLPKNHSKKQTAIKSQVKEQAPLEACQDWKNSLLPLHKGYSFISI